MTQKQQYTGLTPQQVAENRKKYGENILTPPEKDPLWRQFLEKFHEPLIIILLVAGLLSVGIACYEHYGLDKQYYGIIFLATTVIECDADIPGVRLSVGSNSASMWWLNDDQPLMLSGDRRMVADDCMSPRTTLKKGIIKAIL